RVLVHVAGRPVVNPSYFLRDDNSETLTLPGPHHRLGARAIRTVRGWRGAYRHSVRRRSEIRRARAANLPGHAWRALTRARSRPARATERTQATWIRPTPPSNQTSAPRRCATATWPSWPRTSTPTS